MSQWMTVQEASEILGVSVSTFKRFCDSQGLSLPRTPGGHRRIHPDTLETAKRLLFGLQPASTREMPCLGESFRYELTVEMVSRYLELGDAGSLIGHIRSKPMDTDSLLIFLEDLLTPALWRITCTGDQVSKTMLKEIVAKNAALQVLSYLQVTTEAFSDHVQEVNSPILLATFPPSLDSIAIEMISIALHARRAHFVNLGFSVPPEVIAEAAAAFQAKRIFINHTHVTNTAAQIENHRRLKELLPTSVGIVIGGGGIPMSMRKQLGHCRYYESIRLMLESELPRSCEAPHFAAETVKAFGQRVQTMDSL